MLRWFRRRGMSEGGRRRLALALARAEEALVDRHVRNVLEVHDAVGGEVPLARVVELYLDAMDVEDPQASIVERRVLARGDRVERPKRRSRSRREALR